MTIIIIIIGKKYFQINILRIACSCVRPLDLLRIGYIDRTVEVGLCDSPLHLHQQNGSSAAARRTALSAHLQLLSPSSSSLPPPPLPSAAAAAGKSDAEAVAAPDAHCLRLPVAEQEQAPAAVVLLWSAAPGGGAAGPRQGPPSGGDGEDDGEEGGGVEGDPGDDHGADQRGGDRPQGGALHAPPPEIRPERVQEQRIRENAQAGMRCAPSILMDIPIIRLVLMRIFFSAESPWMGLIRIFGEVLVWFLLASFVWIPSCLCWFFFHWRTSLVVFLGQKLGRADHSSSAENVNNPSNASKNFRSNFFFSCGIYLLKIIDCFSSSTVLSASSFFLLSLRAY